MVLVYRAGPGKAIKEGKKEKPAGEPPV